jgi:hypothetical protein
MKVVSRERVAEFPDGGLVDRIPSSQPPLVVDLDGTLVKTDLLIESVLALLKARPLCVLLLPVWMLRGMAQFKRQVALRTLLEPRTLPWRSQVIDYLMLQRAAGRSLVLATGSDIRIARQVASGRWSKVVSGKKMCMSTAHRRRFENPRRILLSCLFSVALSACLPSALKAEKLWFDGFIPADVLHNYANFGVASDVYFNGKPVVRGMRVVLLGQVVGRNFDGNGVYLDLKGSPSAGQQNGVVRIYLQARELDKLQSETYVYESRIRPAEVAVSGVYAGLNGYKNLTIRTGEIIPWRDALVPKRNNQASSPHIPSASREAVPEVKPRLNLGWVRNSPLIAQYGGSPTEVFAKHPEFKTKLSTIRPGFDSHYLDVSPPPRVATLSGQRYVFIMQGCRPHAATSYCAIIGQETKTGEFFLYEWGSESKNAFFGRNDPTIRALLIETLRDDDAENERAAKKIMDEINKPTNPRLTPCATRHFPIMDRRCHLCNEPSPEGTPLCCACRSASYRSTASDSSGIYFWPWAGRNYAKAPLGVRLLIVGESHYEYDQLRWESGLLMPRETTQHILGELIGPEQERRAHWTKIAIAVLGEKPRQSPPTGPVYEFWHAVAYFIFVQEAIGVDNRSRATDEMFSVSASAFIRLLSDTDPDLVLVFSRRVWRQVQPELSAHSRIENEASARYVAETGTRGSTLFVGLPHPRSALFGNARGWNPIVTDAIRQARVSVGNPVKLP